MRCSAKGRAGWRRDRQQDPSQPDREGLRRSAVFTRPVYELLQNRLYIGQTNHKQLAFPGEHAGIIDDELWGAVQTRFRANTQGKRSGVRSREPSLLVGRVFTDAGDRLIPSHTAKGGKRYRYYVSAPGAKRVVRFAARELEQAVTARLQEFLK